MKPNKSRTNKRKSKFMMECLDCAEPFKASDELDHCPLCNGAGEISISNYEDSGWGSNGMSHEDTVEFIDIDNLVFDPDIYND